MITKNDCMTILVKLEDKGLDIDRYMRQLIVSKDIPIDVLRFITENRGIEVSNFYEMLRKSHNKKKSPLYTNILKETDSPDEAITTLSCLLTQVILYSRKMEGDRDAFVREVRGEEITKALDAYFREQDASIALNLLRLIKADMLVLEYANGRRELAN